MKTVVYDKPAKMNWAEISFLRMQQDDILDAIWNFELVLDSFYHDIYFYGVLVRLQPQEYNFLHKILEDTEIKAVNLMGSVNKIKKPVRKNQNIDSERRKLIRRQAPYKISSRIKNKIANEFVWQERYKYTNPIPDELSYELEEAKKTKDKKRITAISKEIEKKKHTWIIENKKSILKSYTMISSATLEDFSKKYVSCANSTKTEHPITTYSPNWFMYPDYNENGDINFDVEEYIKLLVKVENNKFSTKFTKGKIKQVKHRKSRRKEEKNA